MGLTMGYKLADALCEVLGMDSKGVRSIELTLSRDDLPTIRIERYVTESDEGRIDRLTSIGKYYLFEANPGPSTTMGGA